MLPENLTVIGQFGKPHGVKGEINALIDEPHELNPGDFIFVEQEGLPVPYCIENLRAKAGDYLIKIEDVNQVEGLKTLVNKEILAEDTDSDLQSRDEIYLEDLIGYKALNAADESLIGEITDFDDRTVNALFEIEGGKWLIPAEDDFISYIDMENKTIGFNLPDGILDLNK